MILSRTLILKISLILFTHIAFIKLASADSNSVKVWKEGNYRYIQSNGIPDHEPGRFPNAGNPNSISSQSYTFRMPLYPQVTVNNTPLGHDLFGVVLNGVPFDPGTAEYWDNNPGSGWNYEALSGKINLGIDHSHAHVQPSGAYHYHGVPSASVKSNASTQLIGYAADGFPIYYDKNAKPSYRIKQGNRPSGPGGRYDGSFVQDYEFVRGVGNLDECNGKVGATVEYPDGIYHYYVTEAFPHVPRCFKAEPDKSFKKQSPHSARMERGPMPPSQAIQSCENQRAGSDCSFSAPHGIVTGRCEDIPEGIIACVPHDHRR